MKWFAHALLETVPVSLTIVLFTVVIFISSYSAGYDSGKRSAAQHMCEYLEYTSHEWIDRETPLCGPE